MAILRRKRRLSRVFDVPRSREFLAGSRCEAFQIYWQSFVSNILRWVSRSDAAGLNTAVGHSLHGKDLSDAFERARMVLNLLACVALASLPSEPYLRISHNTFPVYCLDVV